VCRWASVCLNVGFALTVGFNKGMTRQGLGSSIGLGLSAVGVLDVGLEVSLAADLSAIGFGFGFNDGINDTTWQQLEGLGGDFK